MDSILSVGGSSIKWTLKLLSGRPGLGVYRLELQLELTPARQADYAGAHMTLGGDLEMSFRSGGRVPLAQLQPIYAVAFPAREHGATQSNVNLGANILPTQLEALERERDGGPLTLHVPLQGTIYRPEDHEASLNAPKVQAFWGELQFQIKATQWVEVLENWKYSQGFLLQVPVVTSSQTVKAVRAKHDLEVAVQDIADGRYRAAIAACRDAFEAAYPDDKTAHPELSYKVESLREAGKDARFWLVRQALWAVTNAAKHSDDATRDIEWERRDAVASVTILAALLEQNPPL